MIAVGACMRHREKKGVLRGARAGTVQAEGVGEIAAATVASRRTTFLLVEPPPLSFHLAAILFDLLFAAPDEVVGYVSPSRASNVFVHPVRGQQVDKVNLFGYLALKAF